MRVKPDISVIMSVYNGDLYLDSAINSILSQSYTNFEFIIINDCSEDGTDRVLSSYDDDRIKIIKNSENIGLSKSLNKGLEIAQGKFIARMDADDISLENRFHVQIDYMNRNTNIGLCGTLIKFIDTNRFYRFPTSPAEVKATLFKTNCIAHPSIMFRKKLFDDFNIKYDINFSSAQDYELFSRCMWKFPLANVPEILLLYRIHSHQVSTFNLAEQNKNADNIRICNLNFLERNYSEEEIALHLNLMKGKYRIEEDFTKASFDWLKKIKIINKNKLIYPEIAFRKVINEIEKDIVSFVIVKRFKDKFSIKNLAMKIIWKLVQKFNVRLDWSIFIRI